MKVIGVILIVATIVAGIWFDIVIMLVGGIEQIVRGVQVHPWSGHDIGWGIAHIVLSGVGVGAAALLCILWVAIFFAGPSVRSRQRQSNAQFRNWRSS